MQKKSAMSSMGRGFGVLSAFCLLSACATFSGADEDVAPAVSETETAAQTMKVAALEAEVARLQSQNARLANEVLAMQRERDRTAAAAQAMADDEADAAAQASLPPAPEIVDDKKETSTAVVDDAASPALEQSDVPVQTAPRLVQPTFASNETVFENEADSEIVTESVLFGVHLASYRKMDEARAGWRQLQRQNPDELGLLEPRVETIQVKDKGLFLRLIGGGFSERDKAISLCAQLKTRGMFCSVESFEGERLSLAETDS
ncbi:SPOR domain-containing protein [Hyphococcus sp.]|uniref:SPOR domain-containing protein n=1 Tax=Hyphococcus sp. TaxID=2038636 RepID=UPI003CCBDA55